LKKQPLSLNVDYSIPFEHALTQANKKTMAILTRHHNYAKKPVSSPATFKRQYHK
jgi:predicted patatin/cPLA2 family phospholipase